MENETKSASEAQTSSAPKVKKNFKINKQTTAIVIIVLVIASTLFYFKGLFVAAIVDGKPISRLAIIKELESASGKQVLDALIIKQLINIEADKAGIKVSSEDIDTEIKTLEDQISKQGGSLQLVLAQQGVTQDQFREQISLKKKLEKLLGEKIQVTDDESNQYIEQNKITPPKDVPMDEIRNQVREQLKNQKLGIEADKFITDLKTKASIQYYVSYGQPESLPEPVQELPAPSPSDNLSAPDDNSDNPPASFSPETQNK